MKFNILHFFEYILILIIFTVVTGCSASTGKDIYINRVQFAKHIIVPRGNPDTISYNYRHFTGVFPNGKMVVMDLTVVKNSLITGYYYIKQSALNLELTGKISDSLVTMFSADSSMLFTGKILKNNEITGKWIGSDGQNYNIQLIENYPTSVSFTGYSEVRQIKMAETDSVSVYNYFIQYLHPKLPITTKKERGLVQIIEKGTFGECAKFNNPSKSIDSVINKNAQEYKLLQSSYDSIFISSMYMWDSYLSSTVYFNDEYILTLATNFYDFKGGAHGFGGTSFAVYDIKSGNKLDLWDILLVEHENEIEALLIQKLFGYFMVDSKEELNNYLFDSEELKLTENIAVNNQGITFLYLPYEIAPYAHGPILVTINYSEIKEFLKLGTALHRIIPK